MDPVYHDCLWITGRIFADHFSCLVDRPFFDCVDPPVVSTVVPYAEPRRVRAKWQCLSIVGEQWLGGGGGCGGRDVPDGRVWSVFFFVLRMLLVDDREGADYRLGWGTVVCHAPAGATMVEWTKRGTPAAEKKYAAPRRVGEDLEEGRDGRNDDRHLDAWATEIVRPRRFLFGGKGRRRRCRRSSKWTVFAVRDARHT